MRFWKNGSRVSGKPERDKPVELLGRSWEHVPLELFGKVPPVMSKKISTLEPSQWAH